MPYIITFKNKESGIGIIAPLAWLGFEKYAAAGEGVKRRRETEIPGMAHGAARSAPAFHAHRVESWYCSRCAILTRRNISNTYNRGGIFHRYVVAIFTGEEKRALAS